MLGTAKADSELPTIEVGPDRFSVPEATPLALEHQELAEFPEDFVAAPTNPSPNLRASARGRAILESDPVRRGRMLIAERRTALLLAAAPDYADPPYWHAQYAAAEVARSLVTLSLQFDRDGLFDCLLYLSLRPSHKRTPDDVDRA